MKDIKGIKYIVLNTKKNKTLLITRDIIDIHRFDHLTERWETSEIRGYLNSKEFRKQLPEKIIKDKRGDKVSLLSAEQYQKYKGFLSGHRLIYGWWWLRADNVGSAYAVRAKGFDVDVNYGGVRPTMWVEM